MDTNELQVGRIYFANDHGRDMKYCGTETYQGQTYHNFYEPVMRLYHWIRPEDVTEKTVGCNCTLHPHENAAHKEDCPAA